jgi:hypothetical protein
MYEVMLHLTGTYLKFERSNFQSLKNQNKYTTNLS